MPYVIPTSVTEPLLLHGDALEELRKLPDASVDVCIADQPSGISFMSKPWDSFANYEPRTRRGREVDQQLGGGDLLARAAEAVGEPGLAEELRAAASARALMPPWARGFVVFCVDMWSEVFRVLKPGAFACVWALPKTADLAALALRAADFETRDSKPSRKWVEIHESVLSLFGAGMNKSGCIGKQIDKVAGAEREVVGRYTPPDGKQWNLANDVIVPGEGGTMDAPNMKPRSQAMDITAPATDDAKRWTGWHAQIAPGHEQWLIARKPTRLTYAQQLAEHGCGAFNVDACRVPRGDDITATRTTAFGVMDDDAWQAKPQVYEQHPSGSHPRNVVLSTGGDGCPARGLDRQSGFLHGPGRCKKVGKSEDVTWAPSATFGGPSQPASIPDPSGGGASRYFTRFDQKVGYFSKASDRTVPGRPDLRNEHPTHKNPDLMRWLVRLMAATAEHTGDKPAVVLDWCMGSGTTGVACVAEGVRFIGIERDPVSVRSISCPPPARITLRPGPPNNPWPGCSCEGSHRVRTRHRRKRKGLEPAPLRPMCSVIVPDEPRSFEVAQARIFAAIGSPEEAAKANDLAPVGAQLGLL